MKFPDKFSDETKRVLNIWADIIQKRHQGIDEDYSDPLLVIEYNQQGLRDRQMTEQDIGNGMIINIILSLSRVLSLFFF